MGFGVLVVNVSCFDGLVFSDICQEQPTFDKKGFMGYMKKYLKTLTPLVAEDRQGTFKKDVEAAVKFLLSKLGDFQL